MVCTVGEIWLSKGWCVSSARADWLIAVCQSELGETLTKTQSKGRLTFSFARFLLAVEEINTVGDVVVEEHGVLVGVAETMGQHRGVGELAGAVLKATHHYGHATLTFLSGQSNISSDVC